MKNKARHFESHDLKKFYRLLESTSGRVDLPQVFRDFLEMAICAFALGSMEKLYHDTIKPYNKKELANFPKMLGCVMAYFKTVESWGDPFGRVYEEITGNFKRSGFGQFFTPESVCQVIAEMQKVDLSEGAQIMDPASGSGRLLLAYNAVSKNPINRYYAVDCDRVCANMTALNMLFHGLQGFVVWGNTISLETWGGFEVNWELSNLKYPHLRPLAEREYKRILFDYNNQAQEVEKPPEDTQYLLNF